MISSLIRIRLLSMFSGTFRGTKNSKKRGAVFKILMAVLAVYVIGCFFFMFAMMFGAMAEPYEAGGFGWLYFALAGLVSTALCFIGSVFLTQSQIYEATDNELLLSMPVPTHAILFSRMAALYVYNLFFALLVLAPAGVMWIVHNLPVSVTGIVGFIIVLLVIPLAALTLSCIFGWLITVVSSRMRNKSLISMLFSIVFIVAYLYVYSKMSSYMSYLVENGATISSAVQRTLPPFYYCGIAIHDSDILSLLLFLLMVLAPFALVYYFISASFIKIVTSKRGFSKIRYQERALHQNSVDSALLRKELRKFVSSPMYVMNSAIGLVFSLIGAGALIVKRAEVTALLSQLGEFSGYTGILIAGALCLMSAMCTISSPSVSLEGRSRWIPQSMPVSPGRILLAKARLHIVISLPPTIIAAVIMAATLRVGPLSWLISIVTPAVLNILIAYMGVMVNVKLPRFDWVNETACVKQSMSVLVSMLGGIAAILIPVGIYFIIPGLTSFDPQIFVLIITALYILLCILARRWILTRGGQIFAHL